VETLFEDDDVQISVLRRDSSRVMLCFAGIGYALGGVAVQNAEFKRVSRYGTAVYVIDKKRSWGNNLDFDKIAEIVNLVAPGAPVDTIGNSMGGFLAILATKFVATRTCIAFVPQFSVHPDVATREVRWRHYLKDIGAWRHRDLGDAFQSGTCYYLFARPGGQDDPQIEMFPSADNIQKIYPTHARFEHNIAWQLRAENRLYDVIEACLNGLSAAEIAAAHFPGEVVLDALAPRGTSPPT
jgi:hypothetical protein